MAGIEFTSCVDSDGCFGCGTRRCLLIDFSASWRYSGTSTVPTSPRRDCVKQQWKRLASPLGR